MPGGAVTKHVFRTTGKYWATEDGFGFVLCVAGAIGFYWVGIYWLAGAMGLIALLTVKDIRRLWQAKLEIDEQSLVVFAENPLTVQWSKVRFARFLESFQKPRKVLQLGISDADDEQVFDIPLEHFDHKRIWELVQAYLPRQVLADEARRRTSAYKELEVAQQAVLKQVTSPLKVNDSWRVKGPGWALFLMFSFITGALIIDHPKGLLFGLTLSLFFTALGLFVVLHTGTIEVDHEAITRRVPLGKYRIGWDEVTMIEQDIHGSLVFYGDHKYLAINSSAYWSGGDLNLMEDFIAAQIESRRFVVKPIRVNFKYAKGTKVR